MSKGKRDPVTHRTPAQTRKMDRGYNSTPEAIKKRSANNKARAVLSAEGLVHKGDGKDVDHIKPMRSGGLNARSNLRVISKSRNRGWRDGV